MAWFGTITDFRQKNDSWLITVEYFDDATPTQKIRRSWEMPLTITKAQAVVQIKERGLEVMRVVTLNVENVIGQTIAVP
jgi:hypothetical protein